jgi:hypothetical protein
MSSKSVLRPTQSIKLVLGAFPPIAEDSPLHNHRFGNFKTFTNISHFRWNGMRWNSVDWAARATSSVWHIWEMDMGEKKRKKKKEKRKPSSPVNILKISLLVV